MSGQDEVRFGGEIVLARVEPVAAEDGKLAVFGELLQTILQADEIRGRGSELRCKVISRNGVCGKRIERIDVVKACQIVEPQNVAMQELGTLDEVADDTGVVRNRDSVSLLRSDRGCMHVRDRAHAANALHDERRIFGGAIADDKLHAAEATAGNPRIGDDAVGDFHLSAQVAFDAGNRVDDRTCHYWLPPFFLLAASRSSLE